MEPGKYALIGAAATLGKMENMVIGNVNSSPSSLCVQRRTLLTGFTQAGEKLDLPNVPVEPCLCTHWRATGQ